MRLLIISPSWQPSSWNGGRTLAPPMALPVLAALSPQDAQIHLVDEHVEAVDMKEDADLLALSFMTAAAPRAYEIADEFRSRGVPVVMGGMHPSALPDEAARHADAVIVGEAEPQWSGVLADLAAGNLKPRYEVGKRPELVGLPFPRHDLLRREKYLVPNLVQTARGCPHACTFCSVTPVFGRCYRFRPVDEVVEELRMLGGRYVGFVDDNIIAKPSRAKELFEALIPMKRQWVGQGDLSMARDPEMLKLMRRSGCLAMFIGIESISQESLSGSRKRPNVGIDMEAAIRTIHGCGIDIVGSFVLGLDGDTVESCRATVDFAQRMKLAAAQFAVLTPFPGTPIYDQFRSEGRITETNWAKYTMGNIVYRPKLMTGQEVADARAYAYGRFYSLPSIARRLAVIRGGYGKAIVRAIANVSYRQLHRGKAIWHSLPQDVASAATPARV